MRLGMLFLPAIGYAILPDFLCHALRVVNCCYHRASPFSTCCTWMRYCSLTSMPAQTCARHWCHSCGLHSRCAGPYYQGFQTYSSHVVRILAVLPPLRSCSVALLCRQSPLASQAQALSAVTRRTSATLLTPAAVAAFLLPNPHFVARLVSGTSGAYPACS